MALSTAFEGYRPTLYTFVGMALAVIGNLTVLRRRRTAAPRDGARQCRAP
jgi:hypothetical protein